MNIRWIGWLAIMAWGIMGCEAGTTTPLNSEEEAVSYGEILEEGALVGMTAAHNAARDKLDLPPLTWDPGLAAIADEWAEHLASTNGCVMEHRPSQEITLTDGAGGEIWATGNYVNGMFIGENLFWSAIFPPPDVIPLVDPAIVVEAWESEVVDYDYPTNSCAPGKMCGHYTQIVWESTERVGCAFRTCSEDGSQVWVCNYYPAGNIVGEKPY